MPDDADWSEDEESPSDEIWRRLRHLEEHRNAQQLLIVALVRELPAEARASLIAAIPSLASTQAEKGEPEGAALLRTTAEVLVRLQGH